MVVRRGRRSSVVGQSGSQHCGFANDQQPTTNDAFFHLISASAPLNFWVARNSVFFATTNGGDMGLGQIFELHLKNNDVQELELIFESTDEAALAAPDNMCASRLNNNLIICEDGSGAEYLHLLRRSGNQIYWLAENLDPGQTGSEWAGACFSPDGQTLFANVYTPGAVFAIWTEHWGTIN